MTDIRIYLSFKAYHKMYFESPPTPRHKRAYTANTSGRDNFLTNT